MQYSRKSVKSTALDSKNRWRDRFKKEYTDKMKEARNSIVNKNRENQWMQKALEEECARFKRDYEQEMREEGLFDIDALINESLEEYQEELLRTHLQEQEELEREIEFYEHSNQSVICVNCRKQNLCPSQMYNTPIARCPGCGFYATESCLNSILNLIAAHSNGCDAFIEFSTEPGSDKTIIANCDACLLWDTYDM